MSNRSLKSFVFTMLFFLLLSLFLLDGGVTRTILLCVFIIFILCHLVTKLGKKLGDVLIGIIHAVLCLMLAIGISLFLT